MNSPPALTEIWGQIHPNLNDYHSDPVEISSTFGIPDITNWWRQQQETHSQHADLFDVARDILFIIPHGVGVDASFALGQDVIGWRQSKTTCKTLNEKAILRKVARANIGLLAKGDPSLDTINPKIKSEMQREA